MVGIERVKLDAGIAMITVPSSAAAEQFFAKLGFKVVSDCYSGDEQIVIMERRLVTPA